MARLAFRGATRRRQKLVLLVVDVTASMGYVDGTRTRLAQATLAAEDVLATLSPGSRANIVWLRAHPAGELPEPGPNVDFLRQALRQAVVVPEPGGIAFRARTCQSATLHRRAVNTSSSSFPVFKSPPGTACAGKCRREYASRASPWAKGNRPIPAWPDSRSNPRVPSPDRMRTSSATGCVIFPVNRAGPMSLSRPAKAALTQTVEAAPWSGTLAVMPVKFPHEGIVPLKATLAEDRFPGDDVRCLLAEVRGALQAGIAGTAEDETARAWLRAARALDAVSARRITPAQLETPGRPDALFVAGWKGESPKARCKPM